MPRSGSRPYECVKRAWHSDWHQPIRGSIIQQFFKVATEAHSSMTRKNREWQEKLLLVVLKVEEIMYFARQLGHDLELDRAKQLGQPWALARLSLARTSGCQPGKCNCQLSMDMIYVLVILA
ncbi:hypothetical protein UlMin_012714 [Ulmus minor]